MSSYVTSSMPPKHDIRNVMKATIDMTADMYSDLSYEKTKQNNGYDTMTLDTEMK